MLLTESNHHGQDKETDRQEDDTQILPPVDEIVMWVKDIMCGLHLTIKLETHTQRLTPTTSPTRPY